ncbi:MAG: hypothetical protein KatS3mg104_1388 [Phycisphaerae bacterium]|jgi:hypothetical protein|nr:MAG: hypothetical protein KatS3mg104_1388 [Phycisphaerae bacterium]
MTVTVDSESLPVEQLGLSTLGDVLSHLQEKNRLVTQVLIDGTEPDLSHIPALRSRRLLGHTIYIETTEPAQIARDVLTEVIVQMEQADSARRSATEHLVVGETNKALQKLAGCFTTWQTARQAIEKVAMLLRVDLERIQVEGISLTQILLEFAEQLRSIRSALESRDYVLLADILRYEIDQTTQRWFQAIRQLLGLVGD